MNEKKEKVRKKKQRKKKRKVEKEENEWKKMCAIRLGVQRIRLR